MKIPSAGGTPKRPRGRGYLRDVVYGGIDGSVTTFAIVAGVAGAGLSPWVIIALGFANLLGDGFSMAAGNYSGTKAELDDIARLRRDQDGEISRNPVLQEERLSTLLQTKGLSPETARTAAKEIACDRELWLDTVIEVDFGLASVEPNPMRAALATFAAFIAAGLIPLIPFMFGMVNAFEVSASLTLVTFFLIGAYKSRWSLSPWWRSGIETLLIGGVAAGIAFVVGSMFNAGG